MFSTSFQKTGNAWQWRLWWQWILANALGETIGLGTTLQIGAFLRVNAEKSIGVPTAAILGILSGTVIEGLVVGMAQWLVLRRPLERLRWQVWVLATASGACIAWTLGMLPSTFLFTSSDTGAAAPGQISDMLVYALAVGMGLVLGSILGVPQWLVLRRHLSKAGWWVLANALAWMLGMVVIFAGTSLIPPEGISIPVALLLLLFVVVAGALVGAVHGLVLIWLLRKHPLYKTA